MRYVVSPVVTEYSVGPDTYLDMNRAAVTADSQLVRVGGPTGSKQVG